jgi:hypothetical protein
MVNRSYLYNSELWLILRESLADASSKKFKRVSGRPRDETRLRFPAKPSTSLPLSHRPPPQNSFKSHKMPPPSQLSIATSSVQRLVKEEASYHKELEKQQARLKNLEDNPDGDENAEFQLRQEVHTLIFSHSPLLPYLLFQSRPPSLPPILPFPSPSSLPIYPSFTPPPTLPHPFLPPRLSKTTH